MPPGSLEGYSEQESPLKTEYDVVSTLRANGHEVHPLGVSDELNADPRRDRGLEAGCRLQPAR